MLYPQPVVSTPIAACVPSGFQISSNHTTNVVLLRDNAIDIVVTVRKLPGSARCPWFNEAELRATLNTEGIRLERVDALTGRRPVSHDVPLAMNAWRENRSFRNYADHATGKAFRTALEILKVHSLEHRVAIMCSEAFWWRCHRRIIADHLIAHGMEVVDIIDARHTDPARISNGAVIRGDRSVVYPATL